MWPGLNTGTYKQYKQHQIDLERYTCVYALSSLCLSDTHTLITHGIIELERRSEWGMEMVEVSDGNDINECLCK